MDTLEFIIKKNNLKIDKKRPVEISNVSRLDLVHWLRELDFKSGIEVGVADAEYSKLIAYINSQMRVYGIDPYIPYKGYKDYIRQDTFTKMRTEALGRMGHYPNWSLIEKFSMDAIKDFNDNSIDFVYIDANHSLSYVMEDIIEWSKKVKKGGIVAGHDYINRKDVQFDVKEAIQKYVRDNNIDMWFILGTNEVVPGQVREKVRSWFFIK